MFNDNDGDITKFNTAVMALGLVALCIFAAGMIIGMTIGERRAIQRIEMGQWAIIQNPQVTVVTNLPFRVIQEAK